MSIQTKTTYQFVIFSKTSKKKYFIKTLIKTPLRPFVRLLSTTGRFSWFLQSISRLMLANIFSKASSSGNKGLIRFLTEFLKTEFWLAKNVVVLDLIVREENSAITLMLSKSVFCHASWIVKKSFCWLLAFKIHTVSILHSFFVIWNQLNLRFPISFSIF